MAFQTHAVFENIISSFVLSVRIENITTELLDPELYGANFRPGTDLPGMRALNNLTKVYIFVGIYLTIALLAAAAIGILKHILTRYRENERDELSSKFSCARPFGCHLQTNERKEQLLVMTIWSGLEKGLYCGLHNMWMGGSRMLVMCSFAMRMQALSVP